MIFEIEGVRVTSTLEELTEKGLVYPTSFQMGVGCSFTLAPMPGCCGVVVSTASHNRVLSSSLFHKIKQEVAKRLGYSLMIATVQTRNFPEVIGAGKNGWKFVKWFRNKRTSNDIGVMVKDIS